MKMDVTIDTEPNVPDRHGVVYSDEVFDSLIEKTMNSKTFIPVIKEDYEKEFVSHIDPDGLNIPKLAGCSMYGSISEIHTDHIILDIDMHSAVDLREQLEKGYKISMVYAADIENNTVVEFHHIIYLALRKD